MTYRHMKSQKGVPVSMCACNPKPGPTRERISEDAVRRRWLARAWCCIGREEIGMLSSSQLGEWCTMRVVYHVDMNLSTPAGTADSRADRRAGIAGVA